jgi:hypothetical protein
MASFCLATGLTPDIYRSLTVVEVREFISAVNANGRNT